MAVSIKWKSRFHLEEERREGSRSCIEILLFHRGEPVSKDFKSILKVNHSVQLYFFNKYRLRFKISARFLGYKFSKN